MHWKWALNDTTTLISQPCILRLFLVYFSRSAMGQIDGCNTAVFSIYQEKIVMIMYP
jgi:hypothetical protein